MLIGTSWYSKTSSNTPRISTETSILTKKRIPSGQFIASFRSPGPCNDSTTKRPLWANLASASRGSKSYASNPRPREGQGKNQATPTKPAVTIPECGYMGYATQQKTQQSSVNQKQQNICIPWGSKSTLAEMQSCDRATSMKVTGYITTSMKLTLPSQIPSPTIDAVM